MQADALNNYKTEIIKDLYIFEKQIIFTLTNSNKLEN